MKIEWNKNIVTLFFLVVAVFLLVFLKIALEKQADSKTPVATTSISEPVGVENKEEVSQVALVGDRMPDFTIETSRGPLSFADLKNKPFVIEFIATNCPYCQASAPAFQSVFSDSKTTYIVVSALNEPISLMKNWQKQYLTGTGAIIATSPGSLVANLGLQGTPTTLFVDAQGKIKTLYPGEIGQEQIRAFLQEIE